eukprot:CAMPEP_0197453160 /NCGR_PEP_ID=MMETSP1175-20131217/34153_1 /TAXON_ID=1003142 /ORGANISM="Triceratium dubium, Strain CCMP147" /LENGTH=54 /DNA_ID=CAMNT_0042986361 /DNA_START=41 /DNA_END=201 /DNA_ORIENTATION=-
MALLLPNAVASFSQPWKTFLGSASSKYCGGLSPLSVHDEKSSFLHPFFSFIQFG